MTGEITLKTFIKLASDPEENYVKVTKKGRIKVESKTTKRITAYIPSFNRCSDAGFSYEVLKSVSEILADGETSSTNKKIIATSKAIFDRYEGEWETLNQDEIERFHYLPNMLSLNAMDCYEVQEAEALFALNNRIGNTIGIDLDRFILNRSLVIRLSNDSTFVVDQAKSIADFIDILCDIFDLKQNIRHDLLAKGFKQDKSNFDYYFGNIKDVNDYNGMLLFLNGLSQAQYNLAATIIPRLYGRSRRLQFAPGCHDNALIHIKTENTIEVRHYFHLAVDQPKAIIRADTVAVFDLLFGEWISYSISYQASDPGHVTKAEKKILSRLKKLGY